MSTEMILCPGCRHPVRRHSSYGCMAAAGTCACVLSPAEMESVDQAPQPVAEPEPVDDEIAEEIDRAEEAAEAEEPGSEPLPAGDKLAALLAKAEGSGSARMYKQAEKVREAVVALESMVTAYEKRIEAERAVAELRRQLAEAEVRLRAAGGSTGPTKAAQRGKQAEQLLEIRKWAWANGLECAKQGRIPVPVMDAYREAHPEMAA